MPRGCQCSRIFHQSVWEHGGIVFVLFQICILLQVYCQVKVNPDRPSSNKHNRPIT